MNRGARREAIFRSDDEALLFLELLGQSLPEFRVEVHAYALMPNHYHLLVRSVEGRLSDAMRAFGSAFTRAVNRIHRWDGPLFRGRFLNEIVEHVAYFDAVVAYIHLNPVRANLVNRPDAECWTSHRQYLGVEQPRPWLCMDTVLRRFGDGQALAGYVNQVHQGVVPWPEDLDLDSGLLRAPLLRAGHRLTRLGGRLVPYMDPMSVLVEVSQLTGVTLERLERSVRGRGANPARRMAIWALNESTSLTHQEIGQRLGMSGSHVANVLHQLRRSPPPVIEAWMLRWDGKLGSLPAYAEVEAAAPRILDI